MYMYIATCDRNIETACIFVRDLTRVMTSVRTLILADVGVSRLADSIPPD